MNRTGRTQEFRRRKSARRWWVVVVVYLLGLGVVLGVIAERRWGWMPVKARSEARPGDPVPRSPERLSMGGLSSRWSEEAIARGWTAGGMHGGFFPEPDGPAAPQAGGWTPGPFSQGPVPLEPSETLGSGLDGLSLGVPVEIPDFKKLGKQ